ncbi:MAG: 30S ribosomal protein S6 [Candidatus Curtissbacteria bacterium]
MYELMVVGTVDGAAALFEKVEKFLKEASVQNLKTEKMGKKTLAYPIAKQTEAEYFLFNFDADSSEILQLDRKIRLEQEAVLRHILIKTKPLRAKKASKVAKVPESAKVVEEPKVEVKPKVTVTTRPSATKAAGVVGQAKITSKPTAAKKTKPATKATVKKGKK